jgi:hypothetical protein
MIENISYSDRKLETSINEYVGRSYSFWESLKMGGTGSQRLLITAFHPVFEEVLTKTEQARKCNIEIRKLGIAIRFRFRLETYGWFIPFDQVQISMENNVARISDESTAFWLEVRPPSLRSKLDISFFARIQKN